MNNGPHDKASEPPTFDKAWQRVHYFQNLDRIARDKIREQQEQEKKERDAQRELARNAANEKKGGYIVPWNWTPEERQKLRELKKGLQPVGNRAATRAAKSIGVNVTEGQMCNILVGGRKKASEAMKGYHRAKKGAA